MLSSKLSNFQCLFCNVYRFAPLRFVKVISSRASGVLIIFITFFKFALMASSVSIAWREIIAHWIISIFFVSASIRCHLVIRMKIRYLSYVTYIGSRSKRLRVWLNFSPFLSFFIQGYCSTWRTQIWTVVFLLQVKSLIRFLHLYSLLCVNASLLQRELIRLNSSVALQTSIIAWLISLLSQRALLLYEYAFKWCTCPSILYHWQLAWHLKRRGHDLRILY